MLASLDPETQREWELNTVPRAHTPKNSELLTLLELSCWALELLQTNQWLKVVPTTSRSSQLTGNNVSTPSYSKVATQLQCSLWNGSLRLFECYKFIRMQAKQRLLHAKQSRLCFKYLQQFTRNHRWSKKVYRQWHKRHHTLLHIGTQKQSTNKKKSANNGPIVDARGAPLQRLAHIFHSMANPGILFNFHIH